MSERDIEETAAKQRGKLAEARANRELRAERQRAQRSKTKARHDRGMLAEALGDAKRGKWLVHASMVVAFLGPLALAIWLVPKGLASDLLPFWAPPIALALAFFTPLGVERWLARGRLAQLRRIGRGFDAARYVDQLSENRRSGRLVMRVGFERPFAESTRDAIPDAIRAWWPGVGDARWEGDTLVIQSAALEGTAWIPGGGASRGARTFTNVPYHTAFLAIIERVLPKLGSTDPIASLSAEIAGRVEAWDADA